MDWGVFPHRDEDKGDWKVASWAIERLREPRAKPLFLSIGFFLPHLPLYVTPKWWDLFPEKDLVLPPVLDGDRDDTPRFSWYLHWSLPEPRLRFLRENGEWRNLVRAYLASVAFVDAQVGRVLDALEESGRARSTVVVLWSHEHRRWLPPASAPPAPGSRDRVLTFDGGIATWEGRPIHPKAPVPGE